MKLIGKLISIILRHRAQDTGLTQNTALKALVTDWEA